MVDFIEYVLGEVRSRRLSKADAAALVRQFARRSPRQVTAGAAHPLLHGNTSDLAGQRYSSTFSGEEFFLADHRVKLQGDAGRRVLPAVAYLEMARAAVEQAWPTPSEATRLELRNVVWVQPIVVDGRTTVHVALLADEGGQVDYEIYTQDAQDDVVHCQGRVATSREPLPPRLELDALERDLGQAVVAPADLYAACARMGLVYGRALQSLTAIRRGAGQLVARLERPAAAADGAEAYVLHPSLMDGALQAAVALLDEAPEPGRPRLPFALETLRVVSPCTRAMVAWLRHAPGSAAADRVVKLDIDLCDERGNVCVQMRGLSWRALVDEIRVTRAGEPARGRLLATPAWEPCAGDSAPDADALAEQHVILCGFPEVDAAALPFAVSRCDERDAAAEPGETPARRYTRCALACFEQVQALLGGRTPGERLVQIVVADDGEQALLAGLSGLLRTAALESPRLAGQLLLVPPDVSTEELGRHLEDEQRHRGEPLVRYADGVRHVLRWRELAEDAERAPLAFTDQGVYLITGGLGGLGLVFAREILEQTRHARVVLTGRGVFDAEKQARLSALPAHGGRATYRQVDLDDLADVTRLIHAIRDEHGRLDGILHSAGMHADELILKKSSTRFREVLAPKVTGAYNLDQASRHVELDFFVLFSAVAGVAGNPGQADYAVANGFLDQFAAHRNRQVAAGRRHGRTRAIDWPLWQAGGMKVDPAVEQRLWQATGLSALATATGLEAFHRCLATPCDQMLVAEGDLGRLRRTFLAGAEPPGAGPSAPAPALDTSLDAESLRDRTEQYLRKEFAEVLKLPVQRIDPRAALENYGIDSMVAMKLTNQLETSFGSLPKTLFFEYQTLGQLAEYFTTQHASRLTALLSPGAERRAEPAPPASAPDVARSSRRVRRRRGTPPVAADQAEPIAIIGLSGRYPQALDLEAYWQNLRDGRDCITEVPPERWDWREYFSADRSERGRHYSKWGGFISGVDEFDPLFFNISPVDAESLDPQERLFLQHAWMAVEDAGYSRAGLQAPCEGDLPGQVGVYVGVMYTEYQLFGAEADARGRRQGVPGSAASIANRVSYVLNLHGPSLTLDTMCSSSLTAIHLACQDLRQRRTSLAIAGGVNVSIHPNKYLVLSEGQFISSDGHCQSFGDGGDGYIPGEGVGVVVLKRLGEARRDGDHIYGVIRGSALNHGGKTNGYSVPNPQAQTSAISRALAEAGVDARHVSYIEAHGTGTKLGDPIEIAALSKAFERHTRDTGFCRIGSAKSNVGHCESAAGIAGLTKVLLQMEHRQIVPSLHSARLNPHIDFARTPFVVNQALTAWESPEIDGRRLPLIAGVSSFGAGGSNAHVVVEEPPPPAPMAATSGEVAILLSARTTAQLQQKVRDLLAFVRRAADSVDLAALAYTLQVGREPMEERLGFVAGSAAELAARLEACAGGGSSHDDAFRGRAAHGDDALSLFSRDADLRRTIDTWIAQGKLSKLLELWVKGLEVDWSRLYGDVRPARVSLPTYPFARERYWIAAGADRLAAGGGATTAVLHPLLHSNTSDLSEQRYRSTFTGAEFFLADHQIEVPGEGGLKVLPGVAYLEMARAAIEQAWPDRPAAAPLELRNVAWAQPLMVRGRTSVAIALAVDDDESIEYEISSQVGEEEIVHGQGHACLDRAPSPPALDLDALRQRMDRGDAGPERIYALLGGMGLSYGPSLRAVEAMARGAGEVLARLRLPKTVEHTSADYVLHPSLLDGALQAAVGLLDEASEAPSAARVPFALDRLRVAAPCAPEMVAWVRYAGERAPADDVLKLDLDLCDARGNVCVQMRGLSSRVLAWRVPRAAGESRTLGRLLATPVWAADEREAPAVARRLDDASHDVIVCAPSKVEIDALRSLLPHSRCLSVPAGSESDLARHYCACALAVFERLRTILEQRPRGATLLQLVVPDEPDAALLAGLCGLLKTAALESPQVVGQLLLVPADVTADVLARHLEAERKQQRDVLVRYRQGTRQVLRWQEVPAGAEAPPIAFKERGTYLITGGLGALGLVFAREILERAAGARVVLTGRSEPNAQTQAVLAGLPARAGHVSYRRLDLENLEEVQRLVAAVTEECGGLDGILHSAGMIADHLIVGKSSAEFRGVLTPKVVGTFHLDQASQALALDFFVLFASVAGAMGNPGQADYAAANGFMDQFAAYRNRLVAAGQRHGRTRAIDWPLWRDGGMQADPAAQERLEQATGVRPMRTSTGIEAFHHSLALPYDQMLVVEGDLAPMRRALLGAAERPPEPEAPPLPAPAEGDPDGLAEKAQEYLRREFAGLLKMPPHGIDPQAALERYGIDSILAMKLTSRLEQTFGPLSKTLFFEYQTLAALAGYLARAHSVALRAALGLADGRPAAPRVAATTLERARPVAAPRRKRRFSGRDPVDNDDIAIVGLAGRYPQAQSLPEFWRNLQQGRDCITEIPLERWDHARYYDPEPGRPGRSYSKWGGFIADVDKFDPLFFSMSPKEAELIDPQERLFLATAWETIEDAGYTRQALAGRRVGVFVGVMWGHYELFGVESAGQGSSGVPISSHASIANRVSYYFDLHGPSLALDTMCSSSLTAIHLACEELRKGEIEAALAGGVNVTIHPYKYLSLSQGRFAASDGRCRSFGAGGDGYVPGEGVGAVLLKPLASAVRDGDHIYAVIKSSVVNHGGKTNGYTVPNPNAQGDLIGEALRKADIDPATLSYIETHGTGTSLGDPIEITGLLKAFEGCAEKQFCPIGSVKSNIGHLESAAGIAALTKVLLQLRHHQLVPSLHADPPNPNIDFAGSPFYVQTTLAEWKRRTDHPLRVGVSSFGAGGANAHLIVEEYVDRPVPAAAAAAVPLQAFTLSAKTPDALHRYAEKMIAFLDEYPDVALDGLAYTSQVGRTPMDARLVVLAASVPDLRARLRDWLSRADNESASAGRGALEAEGVFYGNVKAGPYSADRLIDGPAGQAFLEALLAKRSLAEIARLWAFGADVDWSALHAEPHPRRVSLPTYPFARERCWIRQERTAWPVAPRSDAAAPAAPPAPAEAKKRTCYFERWAPQAMVPSGSASGTGPLLLLGASEALWRAMQERTDSRPVADAVILVRPGESFAAIAPDLYALDLEREEQFDALLEDLERRALLPAVVLHDGSEPCDLDDAAQVARQLDAGLYALFHFCRAFMRMKAKPPALRVVSVFRTAAEEEAPLHAALAGFLKTIVLEDPRCGVKVVHLMSAEDDEWIASPAAQAGLLWDEIEESSWTSSEIRYLRGADGPDRGLVRLVRGFAAGADAEDTSGPLALKSGGVYLITGGLGGLGFLFAEHLARTFQARLVLVGRSAPSARQQERLHRLEACGGEVLVIQADVARGEDMDRVMRDAKSRFGAIHGVIHAAGVNRDAFLRDKTKAEMESVLAPKVYGALNLDRATRAEDLDFFVLFASLAGVMGNVGQADYAYANRFLDSFAARRERLRRAGQRSGRTLSIDWPWWEEGGMRIAPADAARLEQQAGLCPLPTSEGLRAWEELLRAETTQGVPLYGLPSKIAAVVAREGAHARGAARGRVEAADPARLLDGTETYLKELIGAEIQLAPERIGSLDPLESFGLDSVMINRLNARLERDLGALPKTLLYEQETVRQVAAYLVREARAALVATLGAGATEGEPAPEPIPSEVPVAALAPQITSPREEAEPIAIIGIDGRYPRSASLAEYWNHLSQGHDLIDLVPRNRWDCDAFYDPDPAAAAEGKIYCKWGGFLDDHDAFDAPFFRISAEEARILDPQERLFLESVWAALEDAGCTREGLKARLPKAGSADVGVFVGVTTNSYHLWASEERRRGNFVCPTALPWSIANRVSYFFDFNGPSLPVDTACSSSLVAIHLACESLRRRECGLAIAGGVNLYLHPAKYHSLCQKRALSRDGKCHSFGAGDDGFVPGEGVGTLVLKPLSRAIEDRDRIHALIRASAFDHSGRSNGYSAPNPNAQANLIAATLAKAGVHPETIGFVEGHGTGTQLGDSLEIAALTQAFSKHTARKQFCPIGSVKASIGHLESAAGVAGVTKVVLQLQHAELAPSIHSAEPNPNIEFRDSPFYLQHERSAWPSPSHQPRRALVNSFGAGGVNACVIVEEYAASRRAEATDATRPRLFTLSARTDERLHAYARRLLERLRADGAVDLGDLCYTLQVGREAMEERLAAVVSDVNELVARLDEWTTLGSAAGLQRGRSSARRGRGRALTLTDVGQGTQGLVDLASAWVAGADVDWELLYSSADSPRRIGLPTYPFARVRYWVSDSAPAEPPALPESQIHPLIAANSSTLKEVSFRSTLVPTAFYALDHQVHDEKIFPGAGFLEIACVAGTLAGERRVRRIRDVVWLQPLLFRQRARTLRTLLAPVGDDVEYATSSLDDDGEPALHSEGRLVFGNGWSHPHEAEEPLSIHALASQCAGPEAGHAFYEELRRHGLNYGPAFQTIRELHVNERFVLARLEVADSLKDDFGQYVLHPSLIDGALQAAARLVADLAPRTPHLPFALDELDIVAPLPRTCYAYVEWAGAREADRGGVRRFDIRLLTANGHVALRLRNLYVRALAQGETTRRASSDTSALEQAPVR